ELNLPDRQLDAVAERTRRAAELLWREVVARSIPGDPMELDGVTIPVTGPEHITHFATPRFGENVVDTSVVKWNREPRTRGGHPLALTQDVTVPIADLSGAARGAIHGLNGLARETLAARYTQVVEGMAGGVEPTLELRRIRG